MPNVPNKMSGVTNKMLSYVQVGPRSSGAQSAPPQHQQKQKQHPPQLIQNQQQLQEHFNQQIQQQQEQTPPQTQVPSQRQGTNHQLVESLKLPITKSGSRQASHQPPASGIPRSQPFGLSQAHTSQRIRANSDGVRAQPGPDKPHHDTWEDSTIGSLLDSDRHSERDQQRTNGYEFHIEPIHSSQAHQSSGQYNRTIPPKTTRSSEFGPFALNDKGYIRSYDPPIGTSTGIVHSSLQNGKPKIEANIIRDEPYSDQSEPGSTPKKQLKHSKYAIRDVRDIAHEYQDAGRRQSYVETPIYSRQEGLISVSPERHQQGRGGFTRSRIDRRSRDLDQHRSTQFFDLETARQTPVPPDDQSDIASDEDETTAGQRTPRPSNSKQFLGPGRSAAIAYPPPLANNWPRPSGGTAAPSASFAATKQQGFAPSSAANGPRQSGAPRTSSNREQPTVTHQKKRRLSVDYNDQELLSMAYADLKNESFDHDPARSAVQRANTPSSGDTLVQKLSHYQNQDENSQHHFFTQLSVGEWDECGDWFLDRFGEMVGEIKSARREKRETVSQYENQISAREQVVRSRTEKIEQALTSLKHEGEGMMKGKDINL